MNNNEFFTLLNECRIISPVWRGVLDILSEELNGEADKEDFLNCFNIYFSLIDDGNITMSLDEKALLDKWNSKIEGTRILLQEKDGFDLGKVDKISDASKESIKKCLSRMNGTGLSVLFEDVKNGEIKTGKLFAADNGWMYAKKYEVARLGVTKSIDRLFNGATEHIAATHYRTFVKDYFKLSRGQEEAVTKGLEGSLVITGGPGTGKTTSILFLLMGILENKPDWTVHLVAPSGKASSRMKESIIKGFGDLTDEYKATHQELMTKIANLEQSTIHRLLSVNPTTNTYNYNKEHRLEENSIFVVDEASMIDICLFNALLDAIPDNSRIYIMGDKNQLPSVDCGAVFGDLLVKNSIKDKVVELDESRRFGSTTKIYELAEAVNHGTDLPVKEGDWKSAVGFEVFTSVDKKVCPIFYYSNDVQAIDRRKVIESVVTKWGNEFYSKLQDMCSDLDPDDMKRLDEVFNYSETSKILCAENEGPRGVHTINKLVKNKFIDKKKPSSIIGFYPGEIVMVNKNNKLLDLYNGDSGILVTFKDDKTLYFMVKKATKLASEDGKRDDKIFKLGTFVFYPLRMIAMSEIDEAYAITVHKSQGSDYNQILCILPSSKGHPLLNRQIVYTAITRTKGNTYIVSNQERLIEARDTVLKRDTNIN